MRRFARIALFAIVGLAVAISCLGEALAQRRVALVIGNAAYTNTSRLGNPRNDATDIAAAFKSHGIQIIEGFDLDKPTFDAKVREFAIALRGADAGIFFYAGHGLQVNGINYLVPVDAKAEGPEMLEFEMVRVGIIQGAMEQLTRTSILFLDACRNNPMARSLAGAGSRSAQVGRGLKIMEGGIGTLVSFSTGPEMVAQDGDGRNSPYAGALVRHITSSTTDLANILIAVRNEVITQTRNEQVPWDQSALIGQFYFNPALASAAEAPKTGSIRLSEAAEAWDRAKDATSVPMLEAFALRYKETFYADMARHRIEELKKRELAAAEALRVKQAEDLKRFEAETARKKAEDEARAKTEAESKRRELIEQEEARKRAEAEAARKKAQDEARAKAETENKRRELAQLEEERKRAAAEAARKKAEDEVRAKAEADRRRREEEEDRKRVAAETARKKAEEEARAKADAERLRREQEERRRADAEAARQRAEEETRARAAAERRQQEDDTRRRVEAEAAKKRVEWDEAAKECFQEDPD